MKRKRGKRLLALVLTFAVIVSTVLTGDLTVKASGTQVTTVGEKHILNNCPGFLSESSFESLLKKYHGDMMTALSKVTSGQKYIASILYALKNGTEVLMGEILASAGMSDDLETKLNNAVASEIVYEYAKSSNSNYSTKKNAQKICDLLDRFEDCENPENLLKELELSGEIDSDVIEVARALCSPQFTTKFAAWGIQEKSDMVGVIVAYMKLHYLNKNLLSDLNRIYYIENKLDEDFGNAIHSLYADYNKNIIKYLDEKLVNKACVKLIINGMGKSGSSVIEIVSLCGKLATYLWKIQYPDAEEIIKGSMAASAASTTRNIKNRYIDKIQKGTASNTQKEEFCVVYNFYVAALKVGMNRAKECLDKKKYGTMYLTMEQCAKELITSINYISYMKNCIWYAQKKVDDGSLVIYEDQVIKGTGPVRTEEESKASVTARLKAFMMKYPPNSGKCWKGSYGGCIQCFGFARMTFNYLFGCDMPASYVKNARYKLSTDTNVDVVGQLVGTEVTAAKIKSLMASARVGDVIQACGSAYGQHTMIFTDLTDNGIEVYDCNGDGQNKCLIMRRTITYDHLVKLYGTPHSTYGENGFSLYRASNYETIYGEGDGFYDDTQNFEVDENGVLVKYHGWQPFVLIPREVNGVTIVEIGEEAFADNDTMITVGFPLYDETETDLAEEAEVDASPDGTMDSLQEEEQKNETEPVENCMITKIGGNAFRDCDSLIGVSIPDSVVEMQDAAFYDCDSLAQVTLSENMTTVAGSSFENCISLTDIAFPESVESVGMWAFKGCTSLSSIEFTEYIKVLEGEAFGNADSLRKITIPKGLEDSGTSTSVGYDAGPFEGCDNLSEVIFEEGITKITPRLFKGCTAIEEMVIPDTVVEVEWRAFNDCTSLKNVKFSENMQVIPGFAFAGCTALESIEIPAHIKNIESDAFADCTALKNVTLSEGLESMWNAFVNCTALEEIHIPSTLINESMGDSQGSFMGCKNLKKVTFGEGIEAITPGLFKNAASLEEIVIPETVKSIDCRAFSGCSSLKKITLPEKLERIDFAAFEYCTALESIDIPLNVTEIDYNAFEGCTALKNVTLPDGITEIGNSTFSECTSLESINIPKNTVKIGDNAFYNCKKLTGVILPEALEEIGNAAFLQCAALESIEMPEGLSWIGEEAFANCIKLKNVVLGKKLTEIAPKTFYKCQELEAIEIPYGVERINSEAFAMNPVLKEAVIPSTVTEISKDAFSYKSMVVKGVSGSYAETFAKEYPMTFVAIDETEPIEPIEPPHEHSFGEWQIVKEATCTGTGEKTATCEECGETKTGIIEALDHDYSSEWTIDKKATCTEDGSKSRHCSRCTAKTEVTTIPKLGHSSKSTVTKATLSVNGKIVKKCSICGVIISTETIYYPKTISLVDTSFVYDGSAQKPAVTVKDANGNTLDEKTDYTVSYASGRIEVGTYKVTITFKGNYTGSTSLSFKIVPQATTTKLSLYGHDDVKVSWNKVPQADGYRVYYRKAGESSWTTKGYYTGTSVTLPNLADGTKYEVAVRPYKTVGTTKYYATYTPVSIYTLKATTTKLSLYGHDDVKVTWSDIYGESGYKVFYRKAGAKSWTTKGYYTGTSVTLPNLADGTKYEVAVRPYKTVGTTKYYAPYKTASIYTLKATTTKLSLYGYDDVKVTWSGIYGESGYKVFYRKAGATSWTTKGYYTGTSVTLPNLADGAKYEVAVRPYKIVNNAKIYAPYKTVSIYTLKRVYTPKISRYGSKIKVTWSNIAGESGYQISQSTTKTGTKIVSTYNTTSGTYRYVSATKGKYYYYKVRAYRIVGTKKIYGPWSTAVRYRI